MLASFSATDLALPKAFSVSWGASGVRKPLQEAMDVVFSELSHQQGAAALFQQCDEPVQVFRTYLPPAATNLSAEQTQQYVAFGRMLVKCLLEGIHVPLNLSAAMHCMLVHNETLSSHADICITMLARSQTTALRSCSGGFVAWHRAAAWLPPKAPGTSRRWLAVPREIKAWAPGKRFCQ